MLAIGLRESGRLAEEIDELESELQVILPYAQSRWPDYPRHFPYTSYGFVMVAFSKVDLYGQYWFPAEKRQHCRMLSFLRTYLDYPEKESDIAIHLWRHNLMHTSEMRPLVDNRDGSRYLWLFHYRLGSEHMRIEREQSCSKLSLGLFNLVSDLRSGLKKAIADLPNLIDVLKNWETTTTALSEFPRR